MIMVVELMVFGSLEEGQGGGGKGVVVHVNSTWAHIGIFLSIVHNVYIWNGSRYYSSHLVFPFCLVGPVSKHVYRKLLALVTRYSLKPHVMT